MYHHYYIIIAPAAKHWSFYQEVHTKARDVI